MSGPFFPNTDIYSVSFRIQPKSILTRTQSLVFSGEIIIFFKTLFCNCFGTKSQSLIRFTLYVPRLSNANKRSAQKRQMWQTPQFIADLVTFTE